MWLLGDAYVRRLNYPKCVCLVVSEETWRERKEAGWKERGNTSCPKQLEGCTSSFGATKSAEAPVKVGAVKNSEGE